MPRENPFHRETSTTRLPRFGPSTTTCRGDVAESRRSPEAPGGSPRPWWTPTMKQNWRSSSKLAGRRSRRSSRRSTTQVSGNRSFAHLHWSDLNPTKANLTIRAKPGEVDSEGLGGVRNPPSSEASGGAGRASQAARESRVPNIERQCQRPSAPSAAADRGALQPHGSLVSA